MQPHESEAEFVERESLNILFVCSLNKWRSPTAEKIYADKPLVIVRSRGSSRKAKVPLKAADIQWADIIFVMENKHRNRLLSDYRAEMRCKELHVLDIPDDYKFMDPELVTEIQAAVDPILLHRKHSE